MADSGSMKGASAMTGSCSTGSESLSTSKRPAALEAKTARPWAPLASRPPLPSSASTRSRSARSAARAAWRQRAVLVRIRRPARSSSERTSVPRAAAVANSRGSRLRKSERTLPSPARMPAELAEALAGDVVGLHATDRIPGAKRCGADANAPRPRGAGGRLGHGGGEPLPPPLGRGPHPRLPSWMGGRSSLGTAIVACAAVRRSRRTAWGVRLTRDGKEVPHALPGGREPGFRCLCNWSRTTWTACASS